MGRLGLAVADRLDAGAHDLGDEGGGVDGQRQQQRHEFRDHHHAALEIEPAQRRIVEGQRHAAMDQQREDKAEQG